MTAVKVWSGGAWVDSAITEKVWASGAWVEFSPGGGDPYEEIDWLAPPADTSETDGGQNYSMGCRFTVLNTQDCAGVTWRVPDFPLASVAGAFYGAAIWNMAESRLAYVQFEPVEGGDQRIFFDDPISLAPADYIAVVYTHTYVYTSGSPAGFETPSGNVVGVEGRFIDYNGGAATATFPSVTAGLIFHVSPLMVV